MDKSAPASRRVPSSPAAARLAGKNALAIPSSLIFRHASLGGRAHEPRHMSTPDTTKAEWQRPTHRLLNKNTAFINTGDPLGIKFGTAVNTMVDPWKQQVAFHRRASGMHFFAFLKH
jgi:hypothetical protein